MLLIFAVKAWCRNRVGRWLICASLFAFSIVERVAGGTVEIAWDLVPDPRLAGYKVYYGSASSEYTNNIKVYGSVSNATISGLREGNYYFFAVVAFTGNGLQSDFSPETSQFIPVASRSATAFASVSGAYNGLFFDPDQVQQTRAGLFSLFVSGSGLYTGHLQSRGSRLYFQGQLDNWCQATSVVKGPNNESFEIQFRIGGNGQLSHLVGQVSDGTGALSLAADRAFYNGNSLRAPFANRYTCVLPGQGTDAAAPQAFGFGAVQITTSGLAILAATLADGTHVSQSASVSEAGVWPFYAALYSGTGSLISWLTVTNRGNDVLNGVMTWTRPNATNSAYYSAGFTNESQIFGSIYKRPSPVTEPIIIAPNTQIAFTGGELGSGFTNAIGIGRSSRVTDQSSNGLNLVFSISTGTFRGDVVEPGSGRKVPFCGVVSQNNNTGYGLLFGTDEISCVFLGLKSHAK